MKSWYSSKTMWVAILTGVVGVLTVFSGNDTTGNVMIVLSVVQAVLRLVTTEPIK